ncbi:MAG TPA: carbohydrate porin [Paludibacter sp.]|nr:carbohydrate porin [Paludibacter sp.]
MKIFHKAVFLFFTMIPGFGTANAQTGSTAGKPACEFHASYIADLVSNFSGGVKRGVTYLGLVNLKAGFDTERGGLWKGGSAFINIGNTHGGQPSATLVGDFQGISNIEAGNLSFLYELWYKQAIGKFTLTVGLQDLNTDFAASVYGTLFSNSSFGIHSSIADNVASPVFPLTALGANINWKVSKSYSWQAAIFDGTPDDFETNPFNVNWKLDKNQGFLAVSEFQFRKSLVAGKTGTYKFGIYYHQHNDTIATEQRNGGFYLVAEQEISGKISLFSQIGLSPKKMNRNSQYYSIGCNYSGLLRGRSNDQLGIAVAFAGIHDSPAGSETAIELGYKFIADKHTYLKPDMQYIINPAGTGTKLPNALVGFLRLGIEF